MPPVPARAVPVKDGQFKLGQPTGRPLVSGHCARTAGPVGRTHQPRPAGVDTNGAGPDAPPVHAGAGRDPDAGPDCTSTRAPDSVVPGHAQTGSPRTRFMSRATPSRHFTPSGPGPALKTPQNLLSLRKMCGSCARGRLFVQPSPMSWGPFVLFEASLCGWSKADCRPSFAMCG